MSMSSDKEHDDDQQEPYQVLRCQSCNLMLHCGFNSCFWTQCQALEAEKHNLFGSLRHCWKVGKYDKLNINFTLLWVSPHALSLKNKKQGFNNYSTENSM